MDLFKKIKPTLEQIEAAKAQGIYPYFHALETGQDTEVHMYNRKVIMIGSNNYLGLTSHPEVKAAAIAAVEKYGSGCSGSRFLNGTLDIHIALEQELADFLKKEAVTTFSTGFQSNLGIISAIAGRNDYILCDKENHASIYDACRLSYAKLVRYEHNDMEDLENQLIRIKEADKEDTHGILIVTDGVFSMTGDICNLPEIVRLAKKYGARIMIDDAHGLGVLGAHGRGTAEHFGLEDEGSTFTWAPSANPWRPSAAIWPQAARRRIRQPRFPPLHFQCLDHARQRRIGAGGAAHHPPRTGTGQGVA